MSRRDRTQPPGAVSATRKVPRTSAWRAGAAAAAAATALVITGVASATTSPQSEAAPPCPAGDEALFTYPPDYVRSGGALAFTVERRRGHGITAVTVTYSSADGEMTEVLEFGDQDRVRAIRPVPEERKAIQLRFEWVQDAGTPAHCLGVDEYADIPVIAARARAGNPAVPRIAGRWAIRYTRRGRAERARWTLSPRCDVFGCRTRLRSTGGYRGFLEVITRRQYRFENRERYAICKVTYSDGTTVDWTIFRYNRVSLRPIRVRDGAARELVGHRTSTYDAPSDELRICDTPGTERWRIRARRLR